MRGQQHEVYIGKPNEKELETTYNKRIARGQQIGKHLQKKLRKKFYRDYNLEYFDGFKDQPYPKPKRREPAPAVVLEVAQPVYPQIRTRPKRGGFPDALLHIKPVIDYMILRYDEQLAAPLVDRVWTNDAPIL